MQRRNGTVMKFVESVLGREESLWWKRFVKEIGFTLTRVRNAPCEGPLKVTGNVAVRQAVVYTSLHISDP